MVSKKKRQLKSKRKRQLKSKRKSQLKSKSRRVNQSIERKRKSKRKHKNVHDGMDKLPPDVLSITSKFLTPTDLKSLHGTNVEMRKFVNNFIEKDLPEIQLNNNWSVEYYNNEIFRTKINSLGKKLTIDLRNSIADLDPQILITERLFNVTSLNLGGNDFESLPESFGNLVNLNELDLQSNGFESLPTSFGNLDNLTVLDLSDNPLEYLPAEIEKINKLTENLSQLKIKY